MSTLTYAYRAVDRRGVQTSGQASASSEAEALRQITSLGLVPLDVKVAGARRWALGGRVSAKSLSHFTAQLGVLLAARVPISEVLLSIAEQEPEVALREVVLDLAKRIESGQNLSGAMRAHIGVFGEIYVSTIQAAEASGSLTRTLELLSEMLERNEETRRQVKAALTYPAIIVTALVLGSTFLIGYVVPKFAKMFASRNVELPALTKVLQAIGESVQGFWWAYVLVAVGAVFGLRAAWRSAGGRDIIERVLHMIPIIKQIMPGLAIARFNHVLGLSLSAGVGLIDSLQLAGQSAGRPALSRDVERLVNSVRGGGRLSEGLKGCPYITPFCKRMLTAGEAAGELGRMCAVVARHYDRESSHLTKAATTAIEPVLIVGIAGMVLIVALGIFLPMWNMVNLIG